MECSTRDSDPERKRIIGGESQSFVDRQAVIVDVHTGQLIENLNAAAKVSFSRSPPRDEAFHERTAIAFSAKMGS